MADDSLRDVFSGFGASELAAAIRDEFEAELNPEMVMGEEMEDFRDVHHAIRQYDYGDASGQKVSEAGVRARFNPDKVELAELEEGGSVREKLRELANEHLECGIKNIEVSSVTDSEYVVWVVADTSSLV